MLAAALEDAAREVLWQAGDYHHAKRIAQLQALAKNSSGLLPNPDIVWRLDWLTHFLLTNFEHQAALDRRIKNLVEARDGYQLIVRLPYSGPTTLGVILAVTGNIHRCSNYRKYVAYTGYYGQAHLSLSQVQRSLRRREGVPGFFAKTCLRGGMAELERRLR